MKPLPTLRRQRPPTAQLPAWEPTLNDRPPNFRHQSKLYLVRCYACDPDRGRENWGPMVAAGICAWCGWGAGTQTTPS